jgi:maltooligosyltrehalose trehalohydrolase
MRLSVWAPDAKEVVLELEGARTAMQACEGGWWASEVDAPGHGASYGFLLDGEGPLPDPRSPWQPDGVHGLSRTVDHSAFPWTDSGWSAPPLASGVVYELHVGTFTPEGTFESAIDRLDHLVELGVTHVELMPVAEFPGSRGWGYDGVDLFAPHHAYGGPEGLKRLVDACHARGLAVLLDVVYNHLGPDGNYLGRFGPYFTDVYTTPWGAAVNLDQTGSDEVRRFFCDNALYWLEHYHFDGLRIDAVHAIVDTSAVHFLEQLAAEVDELEARLGRHLVLVAESALNDPRVVRPVEAGGYGIDAQWSDDFHHALHVALTGERAGYYRDFDGLADLARALQRGFVLDGRYSPFHGRRHGRPASGIPGWRFLGFLQNHDQVGNRAKGDRATHLMSTGRLKVGAALVLTAPFVPLLFQGEEWGASTPFQYFTDHQDPELAKAVSRGRRGEFAAFGWKRKEVPDPQDPATFRRSILDWSELAERRHAEILEWHRRLIAMRRVMPELLDGRLERVRTLVGESGDWLVLQRGSVRLACNLGSEVLRLRIPPGCRLLLASEPEIHLDGKWIVLPPDSVGILRADPVEPGPTSRHSSRLEA